MSEIQHLCQYFQQHRVVRIIVEYLVMMTSLAVILLSNVFGFVRSDAFAQASCASDDLTHVVTPGETLDGIASSYNTTWQRLASYNHLADPNTIAVSQHICIPHSSGVVVSGKGLVATASQQSNPFPYGACTWWADERYFQLHGMYVPWRMNANAYQWVARAYDFNWHVSSQPSVGAILVLQPWVEGAYSMGHVAIVESVLSNGHVVASNMAWGWSSGVTNTQFAPGPGVSFITS